MPQSISDLRRAVKYGLANGKTNVIVDLSTLKELFDELHRHRQGDPIGDLIQANRDTILGKHEEAAKLIRAALRTSLHSMYIIDYIREVLDALNTFHPMHCESWAGWPKLREE